MARISKETEPEIEVKEDTYETEKKLTPESSYKDFEAAYKFKKELLNRQKEDFLFRLGKQWDEEKLDKLKTAGVEPVTDNLVQSNIFLITGLERQNRSDFKAFPEGEEDSLKAEIATYLFKNSIKQSDFGYKASDAFEDGVTCGEAHLELYLDNTYNLLNGKPIWKKLDSGSVFADPCSREYDYADARYIYKLTTDLSKEDLISLFPEKKEILKTMSGSKIDLLGTDAGTKHIQRKDYPTVGGDEFTKEKFGFDLLERYYKKWVERIFIGDYKTGEIKEAESREKAETFIANYRQAIIDEQAQFEMQKQQMAMMASMPQMMSPIPGAVEEPIPTQRPPEEMPTAANPPPEYQDSDVSTGNPGMAIPPTNDINAAPQLIPPIPKDPDRFKLFTRLVPEIWYFAHIQGLNESLADERAWFYPKWKSWSIIPYYGHFSTAPIEGEDRHLLVQGIVHGIKGAQKKHNSSETLKMMHLNSSVNSGWLAEEDSWVDPAEVKKFGSMPGVNLEYKRGKSVPQRISPTPLSQGHTQMAQESAEAIKRILGINSDMLAMQDDGSASGRAIALRQKQGLVMVQKLFDNLARTKQLCGRLLLSQLGEIYDTETAKKVLGEDFLKRNFPPLMMKKFDEQTGQTSEEPMKDEYGEPMTYDKELADLAIVEVLAGDLWTYDVSVGETVASDTMKLANAAELSDLAEKMPGSIPDDVRIEESQLSNSTKSRILNSMKQRQAAQTQMAMQPPINGLSA